MAPLLSRWEQSLKIKEELGDRAGVAGTLNQVGSIYHQQKKYPETFENYRIAFSILTELQSPDAEKTLRNLGKLKDAWGEEAFEEAIKKKSNDG
ncbi:MAG TPA: hypothetical protein VK186_05675 [Candidatus Deferrimicrobium sp.]|nr:hypothetical protein [Candidatus Deferrimicrobium sp.]